MSIRVILCFLYVIGFSVYAWRNWYTSLCASIVLMAVFQHPDMPKSLAGIQGLNPWNLLFANVTLAWVSQRSKVGLTWCMPRHVTFVLITFTLVEFWTFIRLVMNPAYLEDYSFLSALSEYFINNIKWLLVAVIFFDSCRSRRQAMMAVISVLLLYLLLAIQVIRWVPLRAAISGSEEFARLAYKLIQNEVGYNRVTVSNILGGASWAVLALYSTIAGTWKKFGLLLVCLLITMGQSLTGGRTGYVSWVCVGFVLCSLRWRKLLLLVPVVAFSVITFMPAVRDRMLFGTGKGGDVGEMTSGRTIIWPHVIEYIQDSPVIGYGRLAMQRTGLTDWLLDALEEDNFGHPHNAYLEVLFDSGILGFLGMMPIYFIATRRSFKMFLDREDPLFAVVGGATAAILIALLIGSMAGQTFYPREGAAGMWALIGVMLAVSVEAARAREQGESLWGESSENNSSDEDNSSTGIPVEGEWTDAQYLPRT